MRISILTNPTSGRGTGPALASSLAEVLARRGHRAGVHHGSGAADAADWARRAAGEAERLVVVGGDGTLNAVLAGLPDEPPPVAFTPLGTSNLIAHEFDLPHRPAEVAALLESGRVRPLDLAEINGRRSFQAFDFGIGGELMRRMEERRDGPIRKRQYFPILWRMLRDWRPPRQRVVADGEDLGKFEYGIAAGLQRYASRVFRLGPAEYQDGRWELYLMERFSLAVGGRLALQALLGRCHRARGVVHRRVRHLVIRGADPAPIQVDGDFAGTTPVEFQVLDVRLPLLVAP